MKILLLTDRMDAGGAETHVASLALSLHAHGDAVTVLSSGGRLSDFLKNHGVKVVITPPFSRAPYRLFCIRTRLLRLLKREQFDVLHAHARLPALLLRTLPRRYRGIRAVTVHAAFALTPLSRRFSYWGDATLAVSEDLRIYLHTHYGIPYGRILVIPNGIDCTQFCESETARERDILFVSRLDADCALGARLLLSLLPTLSRRFPHVTLTIAGGGTAFEELRTLANRTNRSLGYAAVRMTGVVSDTAPLYASHKIFVGVSRAAMEAGASGCAVILCGDEGYLGILNEDCREAAIHTNMTCRKAPSATRERLERDLLSLLEAPARLAHSAAFASALVRTRFNLANTGEKTRRFYESIRKSTLPPMLIGGYFGCGNLGDDAILTGTRYALSRIAPTVRLHALCGNARRMEKQLGTCAHSRKNPLSVPFFMKRSRAFLCGGGSLLQNRTSNRSLLYYLSLLHLSHLLGTPPLLYAAGIGPLSGDAAKEKIRKALLLCRRISLRDEASLLLLRDCGVTAPLFLTGDPAFLCPLPSRAFTADVLHRTGLSDTPYFCLILRKNGEEKTEILKAVEKIQRQYNASPLLLVLDAQHDRAVSHSAADSLQAPCLIPDIDTALALLSKAKLVLSERLHGVLLAASAGTPAVTLLSAAPDPKLCAFARLAGADGVSAADAERIFDTARALLSQEKALRAKIAAHAEEERKKAKKDLANTVRMLYNIGSTD